MSDAPIDGFLRELKDLESEQWDIHSQRIGDLRRVRRLIRDNLMFMPVARKLLNLTNKMIEDEKEIKEQKEELLDRLNDLLDERS